MERPQRVLHVLNSACGGAALSVLSLIEAMAAEGITSCAVCNDDGTPREREQLREAVHGDVLFTRLYWLNRKIRMPFWRRPLAEAKQVLVTRWSNGSTARVAECATRWNADLIHTNTILTPEGGLAARRLGLPHVWHLREMLGPGQPFRLTFEGSAFGRYMGAHCSKLLANSYISAQQIRSWVDPDLLEIVPNGIDIRRFQPRAAADQPDRIIVAMVGNLTSRWKKHAVLIDAAARVDPSLPIEWRIYGHDPSLGGTSRRDPYLNSLHAQLASTGMADRFKLPGHVADPAEIMSQIDLLVHPSDLESFGRVVVEGMAAGLPVVGVRGGGVSEIIDDGHTGLLAESDDTAEMARHIERLVRDPQLRAQMGTAGRRRAEDTYSLEACAAGVLRVYEQAMRRPLRDDMPLDGNERQPALSRAAVATTSQPDGRVLNPVSVATVDDAVGSTSTNLPGGAQRIDSSRERPVAEQYEQARGTADGARLRVGVLLDGWIARAWVAKVIEDIQGSDVAHVTAVVMNRAETPGGWRHLHRRVPTLMYALYHRVDRWIFRRLFKIQRDAFDPADLRPLVGEAEVLDVVPRRQRYTDRFDEASIEWIRNQQLDVILRFGFRIIRGSILETARYGVWSLHHGDNREYRGGPPMFWEMYELNPVCGVTLQILTDKLDGGKAIYRVSEKTNLFSLYLNRNRNYWKATAGVLLRLRQLHARGWQAVCELDSYQEQLPYTKGVYRDPRSLVMLGFLFRLVARFVGRACKNLATEEQWFVAWRLSQGPLTKPLTEGTPFRRLLPPRGYFYADPVPIKHQGRYFIFFEDFEYATNHGVISWIELDSQGKPSPPRVALSADCHLSYPFVFEHAGQIYMIPETRRRRRIELWRADAFPDQWKFDRVLMEGLSSVDTTWLRYQDKYWLFTAATLEGTTASDALHIFWSDHPFGPWQPHAANPVVTTIQGARPAGRLFLHDGRLIRPGQDGARVYGHQVHLYHVELLNESEYRESRIATLGPEWLPGNIGTHSYHRDEDYEVIDGRTLIMRGLRLRRRRLGKT